MKKSLKMLLVRVVEGSFVRFLFSYHVLMGRKAEKSTNEMCMQEMQKRSVEKMEREASIVLD